jgi:uncharacterized protein YndB with AHSA1/START domain
MAEANEEWSMSGSGRATTVRRTIRAPRERVYATLIDAEAVEHWMVPDGMTSEVHEFDGREGGTFRISLTYEAPTDTGKTTAQTDTYHGHFATLEPPTRVVQVVEFESDDLAIQGENRITMTLIETPDGTEIIAVHDDVPPGIALADNELGWSLSLAKLAALVENA